MTNFEKAQILIVDDEVDIRDGVAELLEIAGYKTYCAESVAAAMKFGDFEQFDVVVTDISMPDVMGSVLVARIAQGRVCKPSVIVMSGYTEHKLEELYRLGANAVFKKPFGMWDMLNCVKGLLSSSKVSRRRDPRTYSCDLSFELLSINNATCAMLPTCNVANICIMGLCGQGNGHPVELDDIVKIGLRSRHLPIPDKPLILNAVVRWASTVEGAASSYAFGLEFTETSEMAANHLFMLINILRTNTKQKVY